MSLKDDGIPVGGSVERCLDEINEFIATLDGYSPATVAVAMSVHLQCVLCALVECELSTPDQVRAIVRDLERDVFEEIGISPSR